eukprot:CAMPEP_0197075606 /NCGR_PEP_ID=MMETSP1384-20130603/211687_1 /TAXON_ID=29189 /ORGANISM="Ammonia sp." /LENGTH=445 /DNA_ID=CAMNT_0042514455 /DNA_START=188 /DNA_END=1525 /DNA_ORIENTATION=+
MASKIEKEEEEEEEEMLDDAETTEEASDTNDGGHPTEDAEPPQPPQPPQAQSQAQPLPSTQPQPVLALAAQPQPQTEPQRRRRSLTASSSTSSSFVIGFEIIPELIAHVVVSYYYDRFIMHTNILYSSWSDVNKQCSDSELDQLKQFYHRLVELGYNAKRLPKYEVLRYYLGTSKDINRALNKWKGSIDTYRDYQLAAITAADTKACLEKLSKSCHFCGYHNAHSNKPSPVFVLNYESWNWDDFDDLSHVIKASFYICCWMTDNIQAINNGITLMINSKGIRFHHIKRAMTVLRAIQKSLALRTNHVFFLNLPSLAKNSMRLFLKIYPKHIQEKIHICSNTDSLYQLLRREEIPHIFGGSLCIQQTDGDDKARSQQDLQSLGHLLSSYVDIKDFKHFQVDDSDYDYDSDQVSDEREEEHTDADHDERHNEEQDEREQDLDDYDYF